MTVKQLHWAQYAVIGLTFLFALILQIQPWPQGWQGLRPAWVLMVMMYWILVLPKKINIGTAFVIGLCWDLLTGVTLGIHASILVVFAYLICVNSDILRNLSLWLQSFLVILFVLVFQLALFFIRFSLFSAEFDEQVFYGAFLNGFMWPCVVLLLHKIRDVVKIGTF